MLWCWKSAVRRWVWAAELRCAIFHVYLLGVPSRAGPALWGTPPVLCLEEEACPLAGGCWVGRGPGPQQPVPWSQGCGLNSCLVFALLRELTSSCCSGGEATGDPIVAHVGFQSVLFVRVPFHACFQRPSVGQFWRLQQISNPLRGVVLPWSASSHPRSLLLPPLCFLLSCGFLS